MRKFRMICTSLIIALVSLPALAVAQSTVSKDLANMVRDVQQYNFAIHILAMLLVGFGKDRYFKLPVFLPEPRG